jgi:hypothetical protein
MKLKRKGKTFVPDTQEKADAYKLGYWEAVHEEDYLLMKTIERITKYVMKKADLGGDVPLPDLLKYLKKLKKREIK